MTYMVYISINKKQKVQHDLYAGHESLFLPVVMYLSKTDSDNIGTNINITICYL